MSLPYVLSVFADPTKDAVVSGMLSRVEQAVKGFGAQLGEPHWLHLHAAVEMPVSMADDTPLMRQALLHKVEEALDGQPVDVVLQPDVLRRKKLFVSDMDSTLIEQECIDELADKVGIKAQVAEMTARAMRGELDFEEALKARVGLLKGLSEAVLEEVWEKHITLMPGAEIMAKGLAKHGVRGIVVSGGFQFFTQRVMKRLGFAAHRSNQLLVADGKLTGEVGEPICDKDTKEHVLQTEASAMGISLAECMAIGDGANDLPMLLCASDHGGAGVAFHAKPKVAAQADIRITHADMRAVLWLMGIATE